MTPLRQMATINAPEARLITVQPYDKSSIKAIERAIMESDLGLTPNNDGSIIRLQIPELTEERRKQLVKVVRALTEEGKVALRSIRRDVMHDLKELRDAGEAGADDEHRAEEALQKLTDEKVKELDALLKGKEAEITRGVSATYVAIIMDGNGRWAHQHGVPVAEGHKAGADTVKARLRDAVDLGVRELTIYSFSTENWSRPQDEVDALMALFSARIIDETPELHEEGVRMRFVGRREGVLPELIEQMEWAEAKTAENTRITLYVAFNYGGRSEILDAAEKYTGGGEEAFRAAAVRARDARPGPADPDLRRAADLQLPAVAGGVLGAALHRRAVAGLLARGLRGGAGHLRGARAPLRGALSGRGSRRPAREPRKKGTSDLIPRILVAIPAVAFAVVII